MILDILDRITMLLGNREQKELTNYLKLNNVAFSEWKSGKSKSYRKYLIEIAEFFNVSIDYLVYGREKNSSTDKLSDDEQELLNMYKNMTDINKARLLERGQALIEQQPQIRTAYVAARSFNNEPPSVVTGDFSDVLNAPDATDEY